MRNHRTIRFLIAFAGVLFLLVSCLIPVFAAQVDVDRIGSITFQITSGYEHVPGGNMVLMKVADLKPVPDGNYIVYKYVWVSELAGIPLDTADVGSYEYAKQVYDFAQGKGIPTKENNIDNDGRTSFPYLSTGLYLFYQTVPAKGYQTIAPFIVSLPMLENGEYIYDIDASPKPLVEKESTTVPATVPTTTQPSGPSVTTTLPSTTLPNGETTTRPDYTQTEVYTVPTTQNTLPRTGQLKWPVPILAIAGFLLVFLGWLVKASDRIEVDDLDE